MAEKNSEKNVGNNADDDAGNSAGNDAGNSAGNDAGNSAAYGVGSNADEGVFEDGLSEKITETRVVAEGRIFRYEKLKVILPDGARSERDVVRLPGGSVIVPIDSEGYVYLVCQYRAAFDRVILELPAGRLEPGEPPEECARRELLEETGLRAGSFKLLSSVMSSPGYSDEVLHIYLATDLDSGEADPDEGEFLNVMMFPFDEVVDMAASGDIRDAKTVAGVLLAERAMRLGADE